MFLDKIEIKCIPFAINNIFYFFEGKVARPALLQESNISNNMPETGWRLAPVIIVFALGFSLSSARWMDARATRSRRGRGTSGTAIGATMDGCHTVSSRKISFSPFAGNERNLFLLVSSSPYTRMQINSRRYINVKRLRLPPLFFLFF